MTLAAWLRRRGGATLRRLPPRYQGSIRRLGYALLGAPAPAMVEAPSPVVPVQPAPAAGQYQSFADVNGASDSWGKLAALKLPLLAGKSFLDIGCNEGFFCGFANFQGAAESVGIDRNAGFLAAARRRFPACDFREQDWTSLPDRSFDVILLASALHYADNQAALVRSLVEHLTPTGTLVLELGVLDQPGNAWVEVQRGIDRRSFPTWQKLGEVLDSYAWKHIGPSVRQAGDPVGREVIHIQQRRPFAYLLMMPPAHGKTTISHGLFARAGVPAISGDALFADIAGGGTPVSSQLAEIVAADFSTSRIDQAIRRAYDAGLAGELVDLWVARAAGGDFAFDGFVPLKYHREVVALLEARHYQPIRLEWERPSDGPPSAAAIEAAASGYRQFLVGSPETPALTETDNIK